MLYGFLLFVHLVVSVGLVVSVLMQSSKGGGLAGTFGGSGITGGVFGGRGAAPFLARATTVFAVLFMLTSLSLSYIRPGSSSESVFESTSGSTGTGSAPAVMDELPFAPADNAAIPAGDTGDVEPGADIEDTGEAGTE